MDRGAWWATTESDTTWQLNTYPGGQAQVLLSELNKGTPIYSQAEEQGPPDKLLSMIRTTKATKSSQRNNVQHGVRIGFLPASDVY